MKKIGILAVLLLLVVMLTACSGTTEAPAQETGDVDTSLTDVQAAGVLTVGSDIPYPPMEYIDDNGEYVGFDMELIKLVAQKIGVEAQISVVAWDVIFDEVKAGNKDVIISSITITPERQETMLFSNPYFNAGQVVVTTADSGIAASTDLSGKSVGVQTETTGKDEAENLGATVTQYDLLEDAVTALQNGAINAIVVDYIVGAELASANGFVIAGEPFTNEFYGIASAQGNNALMDAINSALKDLKNTGEIENLKAKYMN